MVLSTTTKKTDRQRTASTTQRRSLDWEATGSGTRSAAASEGPVISGSFWMGLHLYRTLCYSYSTMFFSTLPI